MHGSQHQVDADALLAHGEFVRALARRLVFDDDRADDVVQETWLAALEHAPDRPRSLRAWLARVARNIALKASRTESRRRRRDEGAPEPRPPEPPPDAVDRLARGRQVVDAVLALDEPYRTTVVLRFYEDLEPREIARRLGVEGATVRTRLKRGLDMLRARLDDAAGGRRAWCLALLPVLVPHGKPVTGGLLLMSAKSKLSIFAVLLLAATAALFTLWRSGEAGRSASRAPSSASASGTAPGSGGAPGAMVGEAGVVANALRVVVRVEDEAGRPLPGATVEAYRSWFMEIGIGYSAEDAFFAGAAEEPPVATATTDATGIAAFRHEPGLAFVYRATKEGCARADSRRVELRGEVDPEPVTLRLGPAYALTGFVLDEAGQPIAGAPVLAAEPAYGARVPEDRIPARTVSGADGSYRFGDLPPHDVVVWAAFPGGVPWRIATLRFPHLNRFDVVLARGGVLTGAVTDGDTGEPIAGARVRVMGYFQHRAEVFTDAEGRYEMRSLPGTLLSTMRLQKEGYYQVIEPRDQIGVWLGAGDALRIDARMRRAPVLRGTVRGPDGPLADTKLQISNWWTTGVGSFESRTDAEGRYAIAAAPGRFVVLIASRTLRIPGSLDWSVRPDSAKGDEGNIIELPERGEVVRDFALESLGDLVEVSGTVVDRGNRPVGGARVVDALSAADGTFRTRSTRGFPVWATKPGYSMGKSEPVEEGREVRIVLAPAAVLSGTVTARDGGPVDAPFVLVAREPQDDDHNRARAYDRLWLDAARHAASGGRYEIRDLEPGKYLVRAGAGRHALAAAKPITLDAAGEQVLDFALEAGEAIRGRIVEGGTGAPVRGAWVRADPLDAALRGPDTGAENARMDVVAAVSGDDGSFEVGNVARGEYEIRAEARGYLDGSVQAAAGGAPASIALERAFEIRGIAEFPDGKPAVGIGVLANKDGNTNDRVYGPATGPDGRFVVSGLARGLYRVTVGGFGALSRTSGPVEAGASELRLVVEKAGPGEAQGYPEVQEGDATIEGTIVDSAGQGIDGVRVYASPMKAKRDLLGRMTRSGPDGRFVLRGLPAEPHRVRAAFEVGGWSWQIKEGVSPGRDAVSFEFASISGTVVGEGLDGRQLTARSLGEGDGGWRAVALDRGGAFRIPGLVPGVGYRLSFKEMKDQVHLLLEGGEDIAAGRSDVVLRATKGASIAGVVVDDSGRPVAGVRVVGARAQDGTETTTGADGGFDLTGLVAGANYMVAAEAEGKVPAKLRVDAPASGVRIVVEKGFDASGRLLDAEGRSVPDTQLRFLPAGDGAPQRHAQTDSQGRFAVDGLRDGEYRVEMWPKVVLKAGDPMPEWQPVGTIRARDRDVELRVK